MRNALPGLVLDAEGGVVGVIEEDADDSIRTCGCGTAAAYVIAALMRNLVIIMGVGINLKRMTYRLRVL
jgi:hypothetical protein